MTAIAILLVIALIGFLVAIGSIIAVVLSFRKLPGRIKEMTAAPTNSAVEVLNTGKGIYEVGKIRYDGYVKHGTRIVNAVKETSDELGTAAKSVDVNGAADTIKKAAISINAAQEGLSALKAVLEALSQAQKNGS